MFTAERYEVRRRSIRLTDTYDIYAGTGDTGEHILRAKRTPLHRRDTFQFEDPATSDIVFRVATDPPASRRRTYMLTDERTNSQIGTIKRHSSDFWRQTWELSETDGTGTTKRVAIAAETSILRAIIRHHISHFAPIAFDIYGIEQATHPDDATDDPPLIPITGTGYFRDSYVIDLSSGDSAPIDPRLAVLGLVVIDGLTTR